MGSFKNWEGKGSCIDKRRYTNLNYSMAARTLVIGKGRNLHCVTGIGSEGFQKI